ncbi:MAG: phospholipid carrier-dependent glycosyltransferase [Anaerolineae bacterium]
MRRMDAALLALLFAFALLLRVGVAVAYHFDGLYGQDPFAYYDFAAALAQGHAPAVFFWPLGYPALLAAGFWLFGISAATAQGISLLLGALLSPLVYALARHMDSGRVGAFVAGLLMAVCGQALQSSLVVMADIPALAWTTVSALCLWRYKVLRHAGAKHALPFLVLCALTLALACITRWLCLICIPLWGIIYLTAQPWKRDSFNSHLHNGLSGSPSPPPAGASLQLRFWRGAGFRVRSDASKAEILREMLLTLVFVLLVFLPQVLYSRSNPYPTLNHAWVQGWSPSNALAHEFTNLDGYFSYERINAIYYAQVYADPYYLAPVWTPFVLLGLVLLLHKRQWSKALFLGGWALLPYLFLVGIPYQNIRFPLLAFPAVAVLAGIGFAALLEKAVQSPRKHIAYGGWACLVLCFGLLLTGHTNRLLVGEFLANQQYDRQSVEWAAAQIPDGARVYSLGLTLMLRHYTDYEVYELYNQTPATLSAQWQYGEDDYLLVSVWSLQNQWQGREPDIAVHWLLDHRGLVRLNSNQRYTLFRINGRNGN